MDIAIVGNQVIMLYGIRVSQYWIKSKDTHYSHSTGDGSGGVNLNPYNPRPETVVSCKRSEIRLLTSQRQRILPRQGVLLSEVQGQDDVSLGPFRAQ